VGPDELQTWKDKLFEERDDINTTLQQQKATTATTSVESAGDLSSHASHMADQGTDTMEREKAFLFISQKRQRLEDVDEALARIEAGTFGVCELCEQNIPQRRLESMPTASLCVPCKEKQEKSKRS